MLLTVLVDPIPALATTDAALVLQGRYAELQQRLAESPFDAPVVVDSTVGKNRLHGEIHAYLALPYQQVAETITSSTGWCRFLYLSPKVSNCQVRQKQGLPWLRLRVTPSATSWMQQEYTLDYRLEVTHAEAEYTQCQLVAEQGPAGTRDYRIQLETAPVAEGTFLRFSFSYTTSTSSRFLTQVYLATLGAHKVGFTVIGRDSDGKPVYIKGLRGIIERNAMRHFLALEAWLTTRALPDEQRLLAGLQRWFDHAERFPRQLREMDRQTYLRLKGFSPDPAPAD
jgi:hypothetical protein